MVRIETVFSALYLSVVNLAPSMNIENVFLLYTPSDFSFLFFTFKFWYKFLLKFFSIEKKNIKMWISFFFLNCIGLAYIYFDLLLFSLFLVLSIIIFLYFFFISNSFHFRFFPYFQFSCSHWHFSKKKKI